MEANLLERKTNIPRTRNKFIERKELFNILNQASDYKLIIVSAPAGYGKSTLISLWIDSNPKYKSITAWISLDEGNNDQLTFWKELLHAIGKVKRGIGDISSSMLQSLQSNKEFLQGILSVLISELSVLNESLFIVLDDFHIIENIEIYSDLKFLIKNMPDNFHLIILSRVYPELGTSRLRASDNLLELTQTDLNFTRAEVKSFFENVMDIKLCEESLDIIYGRTEGWAVGLQLAALSLKDRPNNKSIIENFNGDHKYILDYLVEEIFSKLSPETQEFLMKTSIVNQMCASLCRKLTNIKDTQHMLERLDSINMFIVPLDDNRVWYRYHNLFREFLINRLKRIENNILPELYFKAGKWFEENELPSLAVTCYLKAEKYDAAVKLIENSQQDIIVNGEMKKVYDWCSALPFDKLLESPRLCINMAWYTCINGDLDNTQLYIGRAENAINPASNCKDDFLGEIMIMRAIMANAGRDSSKIIEYSEKADPYIRKHEYFRAIITLLKGSAYIYNGQISTAGEYFKESLKISKETNNYYIAVMANRSLMISKMIGGYLHDCESECLELLQYFKEKNASEMPVIGILYNDLSSIYYEWNNLELASEYAKRALAFGEKGGITWILCASYASLSKISFALGQIEDAFENIKKAEQAIIKDKIYDMQLTVEDIKANLNIRAGNLKDVDRWLIIRGFDAINDYKPMYIKHYMTQARYLIEIGSHDMAMLIIDKFCSSRVSPANQRVNAEALIIRSILYQKKGFLKEAIMSINKAIELSYHEEYIRLFIDEGKPLKKLLNKLIDSHTNSTANAAYIFLNQIINEYDISVSLPKITDLEILSIREVEILKLLEAGLTNIEIAEKIFVSINTIKTHLLNIYTKLDVHHRTQAVAKARELNIL
jgi:LuxR family transcriptional regulator, maltose regulon positive regulatory protein